MSRTVWVLNGPNLARLGKREPGIYGHGTYDDLVSTCQQVAADVGLAVEVRQTDDESAFIGWLHQAAEEDVAALVLNPAAWTHTSIAIRDAVAALAVPMIEVHLSNPLSREEFRHTSYTAGMAVGVIAGFGFDSYRLALDALSRLLS